MPHYYLFLTLIFLTYSCASHPDFSKNQKNADENRIDSVSDEPFLRKEGNTYQLIKTSGWNLPDLSRFSEVSRETISVENVGIVKTEYKTKSGFHLISPGYNYKKPENHWSIRFMFVFDVDGKPFLYFVRGDRLQVDDEGKVVGTIATTSGMEYQDDDGDGRFETFKYSNIFPNIETLPTWIRSNGTSN